MWYKSFTIVGKEVGEEASICCNLGNQSAETVVKVVIQTKEGNREKIKKKKRKGGFISDIVPSTLSDPIQRAEYNKISGEIKIYVKFPGVERYLSSDMAEIESSQESRVMLAEIIGEAFCKTLARKKLDVVATFGGTEGRIDAFNNEVNNIQKKYMGKIHDLIYNIDKLK
jgi:hypothetical protein